MEAFVTDWLSHKTSTKSEATAARYRTTTQQFVTHLEERAARPLSSIRTSDLQEFLNSRGKIRSTKTISIDSKTLAAAFADALRQGLISRNPVSAVEMLKTQSNEREGFTSGQVRILVASAQGDWLTCVLLGFFTGARLSDIVDATWQDVNLLERTLFYRQRKTGVKVVILLR